MRVLYSFPFRLGEPGVGTTAFEQVRGLAAAGVEVSLFCASVGRLPPGVHDVVETLVRHGVRLPHRALGVDRAVELHDRSTARHLARAGVGAFDLVHGWPGGCLHTFRAARELGIAGVREMPNTHASNCWEVVAALSERLGLPVDRHDSHQLVAGRLLREVFEYEIADAMVCPSESVAASLQGRGIPAERIVRHQYGFDPSARPVSAGISSDGGRFRACHVGRLEPRKGVHVLLEAWSRAELADATLTLVGRGEPQYVEWLRPLLGLVEPEMMPFTSTPDAVMRASHVLVLPSYEEGSALVGYEARGSGCAVLASNAAGTVMTEGVLLHDVGDVDGLAEQLHALATDRGSLERLRAAARGVAGQLTWDQATDALLEAYGVVLARRRQPGRG